MNVYQTNDSGYFVGVTSADQDPLNPNNWLIPAGCVEIEPPAHKEGFLLFWSGGEWSYEDIREPEPEPEPEPTKEEVAAQAKANLIIQLKTNLRETDYVALPDYDKERSDILKQRQGWREEIRELENKS